MLPVLGMHGLFTFKTPFDTEEYKVPLTVIALRTFQDLQSEQIDVLNLIYKKASLKDTDYQRDLENKEDTVAIFKDGSNQIYRIPISYITNTPISDGELFEYRFMGFSLGYVPANFDIGNLTKEVEDLVLKNLGVKTKLVPIKTGRDQLMTKEEVNEFNARVNANRTNRKYQPMEEIINELRLQNERLKQENNDLNKFLANRYNDVIVPSDRPTEDDIELYAKKIKIEVKTGGLVKPGALSDVKFMIYNPFNTNPITMYITRSSQYENDENKYACVLNGVHGTMTLVKGTTDPLTPLPRMFSRGDKTILTETLNTILIELNEPLNIRGFSITPHDRISKFAKQLQVTLYNKNKKVIYVVKDDVLEDASVSIVKEDIDLKVTSTPETPLT